MDLLRLGIQSRKTGLKAKENLGKDQYDMEDIDEFFDETIIPEPSTNLGRLGQLSPAINRSLNPSKTLGVRRKRPEIEHRPAPTSSRVQAVTQLKPHASPSKTSTSPLVRVPMPEESGGLQHEWDQQPDLNIYDYPDDAENEMVDEEGEELSSAVVENPSTPNARTQNRPSSPTKRTPSNVSTPKKDSFLQTSPKAGNSKPKTSTTPSKITKIPSKAAKVTKNLITKRARSKVPKLSDSESEEDISMTQQTEAYSDEDVFDADFTETQMSEQTQAGSGYEDTQHEYVTNPTPLPSPPPEGLRRSKRTKIAPLAYWRNERIVYTRANESHGDPDSTLINDIKKIPLQEIHQVVHVPEAEKRERASVKKHAKHSKKTKDSKQDEYDYTSDPEIDGSEWFKDRKLDAEVFENADSKITKTIAWAPNGGDFKLPPPSKNGQAVSEQFQVAPLFDTGLDLIAAGLLEFPFEGFKSLRTTGESLFLFHVAKGLIEVTLNNDTFVVTRGCSFEIPRFNIYSFKNIGYGSARLFFVQCQIP